MGLLFRTPDTADVLAVLNGAFDEHHLTDLAADADVMDWFGTGPHKKKLWQIASRLNIWPRSGNRGKGRWFTFLKDFLTPALDDEIKAKILEVLQNVTKYRSIRFETAEDTAMKAIYTDIPVPTTTGGGGANTVNIRLITLFTKALPTSNKGDSTDDP